MTGLPQAVERNQNSLGRIVRDIRVRHQINDIARNMPRIAADATQFLQNKWKLRDVIEITPPNNGDTAFPDGTDPWILETVRVGQVVLPKITDVEATGAFGYSYVKGAPTFRTTEAGEIHRITYRVQIRNPADPASPGRDVLPTHYDIMQAAIMFRALEFYKRTADSDRELNVLNGLLKNEETQAQVSRLAGRSIFEGMNAP